jgi:hypothetical protein
MSCRLVILGGTPNLQRHNYQTEMNPLAGPPSSLENDDVNTKEEPSVIPVKSSASVRSISLDSNNKDESNRLEQLFVCPHCTKFRSNIEDEYQCHIVLKHPRKPGFHNMTAEDCNR